MNGRGSRILLGVVGGGAVGAIIFLVGRLQGVGLFVLAGASAGAAVGLLIHAYSRNIDLELITVSIPQLSELQFAVSPNNRLVAWKIFIEVSTRVSTQPLRDNSGSLREALTSLYDLFQAVRTDLRDGAPSRIDARERTVEELGVALLNRELRPFLSYWHPLLQQWEKDHEGEPEETWERNSACRAELAELQSRIKVYAVGFAKLARIRPIESLAETD